jgi:uncharacterized repeat protein (TIGR03943 family)
MTRRSYRAFQALILAGLGIFLIDKIWTGTLFWYINARFMPLTVIGALGVLWLAQALLAARGPGGDAARGVGKSGSQEIEGAADAHAMQPAGAGRALLLLALPILLGALIPATPLTAEAIDNRGLSNAAPLQMGGSSSPVQFTLAPEERTILDWLREFQAAEDPASFAGQAADVVGFVYHEPRLPDDQFMLARFTLICCVADASAIAVQVTWANAATIPSNEWVRVRGPIAVGEWEGRASPMVLAESVEFVDPPDQPYLYP